jgi:hypothetical protein
MFVIDPMAQGLELLAQRELQRAESLFLQVINDPYSQKDDLTLARSYLTDIRACQTGNQALDFDNYRRIARKTDVSLDPVYRVLSEIYFSPAKTYQELDQKVAEKTPNIVNRLKQVKIRDIVARDDFFQKLEKKGIQYIKKNGNGVASVDAGENKFDLFRWKTVYRKFIEQVNPILLERHLEMLAYIYETGEMELLEDPKLTVLTPKYRWILESTLKSKWYLLRSYFFKAKSEIQDQFKKKEGTRKYWEEVKYKKISIFEQCHFRESHIQKFLFIDKLNYKTLEEIYQFARSFGLDLVPRDVSLALRGVSKAKDHIRERGGFLMGSRKEFQDQLIELGFSRANSYKIARQAKRSNCHQVSDAYQQSLAVAMDELSWYRIPATSESLRRDIEAQCCKHLSTVRIHLFERGRLNKLLLQAGKGFIREYLSKIYGEKVASLHCYFRLETIHQYYKLKYFQYHAEHIPSVSELIKISRKEFQPILVSGYQAFIKKRRLNIPADLVDEIAAHKSVTCWEDTYTTPEEKLLLKFWFLMDHGVSVTQGLVQKGLFKPGEDIWKFLKIEGQECKS